jgi:hypothetical protein
MREPHQRLEAVDLEAELLVPRHQVLAVPRTSLSSSRFFVVRCSERSSRSKMRRTLIKAPSVRRAWSVVVRAVHESLESRVHFGARRHHDDRDVLRVLLLLIAAQTSKPVFRGRRRSRITRSGASFRIWSSPLLPWTQRRP